VFAGLRRQVWLLLAVVVIALSLLAMHQLSSNHTVAGTSSKIEGTAAPAGLAGQISHHPGDDRLIHVHAHDEHAIDGHAHGQQVRATALDHAAGDGDCPDCAHHQAMALTCLAALILFVAGWVVSRPAAWRGVLLRRLIQKPETVAEPWRRHSLSLRELSVSRT